MAWFGEKIDQKNILRILPPPRMFRFFFEKNEKCLQGVPKKMRLGLCLISQAQLSFVQPKILDKKIDIFTVIFHIETLIKDSVTAEKKIWEVSIQFKLMDFYWDYYSLI